MTPLDKIDKLLEIDDTALAFQLLKSIDFSEKEAIIYIVKHKMTTWAKDTDFSVSFINGLIIDFVLHGEDIHSIDLVCKIQKGAQSVKKRDFIGFCDPSGDLDPYPFSYRLVNFKKEALQLLNDTFDEFLDV